MERPAVKENGKQYYEYIFIYVDYLLIISEKMNENSQDVE
jgi:hypothetical protein